MSELENTLWVEKYRPKKIKDCILPEDLKKNLEAIVARGDIPHLMLCGTPGTGKTTAAIAMCEEIGLEYMIINGSEESGIDVLRTKIKNYASSLSLGGTKKVVIIDEADYLNAQSTQPALRRALEEFHTNCRFIFTCNYKDRIIAPLHSRCQVFEFRPTTKEDKVLLVGKIYKRLMSILEAENVEYVKEAVLQLAKDRFPDFRKTIIDLQKFSNAYGKIDQGVLAHKTANLNLPALIEALKKKEYLKMRQWAIDNMDQEPAKIYSTIYAGIWTHMEQSSIPLCVVILADYMDKATRSLDQEITLMGFLTAVMSDCKWL